MAYKKELTWILKAKDSISGRLKRVGKSIKGFASSGVRAVNKLLSAFTGLGGAVSVGGLVYGLKRLVGVGDDIGKAAKRAGTSAEEFQKLAFAARRSGGAADDVEKAFKRMSSVIVDAENGLTESIRALDALGLTFDQLKGKDPAKQFDMIALSLAKIEDKSLKSAIAQDVFGRAGTNLLPMLDTYKALGDEVEDMGGVMSNEAVKAAEDLQDGMENLKTSLTGLVANSGILEDLADFVSALNEVNQAQKKIKKEGFIGSQTETGLFDSIVDTLAGGKFMGGGLIGKGAQISSMGMIAQLLKKSGLAGSKEAGQVLEVAPSKEEMLTPTRDQLLIEEKIATVRRLGGKDAIEQEKRRKILTAETLEQVNKLEGEILEKRREATKREEEAAQKREEEATKKEKDKKLFQSIIDDMNYRIKLQRLLNKEMNTEAEILRMEKKLGRELTDEEKEKFAERQRELEALQAGRKITGEQTLDRQGPQVTALERIGALMGGGRPDKGDQLRKKSINIAEKQLKELREIRDRTGDAAIGVA
jgi:hypothetical protein